MSFVTGSLLGHLGIPAGGTETERAVQALLESGSGPLVAFGDQRLNSLAAQTFNESTCVKMYELIEKSLLPSENDWRRIYNALLLLRTCTLFGSEHAVDKSIGLAWRVHKLVEYNSAMQQKQGLLFTGVGGTDQGGPVREQAGILGRVLASDASIRNARHEARNVKDEGNDTGLGPLVPMGEKAVGDHDGVKKNTAVMSFGQGMTSSVGAGFDLQAVPGMYEGRPERFFDNPDDPRSRHQGTGDAQHTRDAMFGSSLLDLPPDDPSGSSNFDAAEVNKNLPAADYLPALQRQKELEAQLSAQQRQLEELQRIHSQSTSAHQYQQQYQQQHQQQQPQSHNPLADILSMPMGSGIGGMSNPGAGMSNPGAGVQGDLLGLASTTTTPPTMMGTYAANTIGGMTQMTTISPQQQQQQQQAGMRGGAGPYLNMNMNMGTGTGIGTGTGTAGGPMGGIGREQGQTYMQMQPPLAMAIGDMHAASVQQQALGMGMMSQPGGMMSQPGGMGGSSGPLAGPAFMAMTSSTGAGAGAGAGAGPPPVPTGGFGLMEAQAQGQGHEEDDMPSTPPPPPPGPAPLL